MSVPRYVPAISNTLECILLTGNTVAGPSHLIEERFRQSWIVGAKITIVKDLLYWRVWCLRRSCEFTPSHLVVSAVVSFGFPFLIMYSTSIDRNRPSFFSFLP